MKISRSGYTSFLCRTEVFKQWYACIYFASVWIFWNTSENQICCINCNNIKAWEKNLSIFNQILLAHLAFFDGQKQGIEYSSELYSCWITWERERLWWHKQIFKYSLNNHSGYNCKVSTGWRDHISPKKWSPKEDKSKCRVSQGLNGRREPQNNCQGGRRRPISSWDTKKGSATQDQQWYTCR